MKTDVWTREEILTAMKKAGLGGFERVAVLCHLETIRARAKRKRGQK